MTGRPHARPSCRGGFTLLELIIAMAIAATIALVLYSTLTTAYKARGSALNQTTSMREAAIALDLIEADIENAIVPRPEPTPPAGRMGGPMYGEADSLEFYTLGRDVQTTTGTAAATSDVFADGVRQILFSISTDNGTNVLNRGVQRNVLATTTAEFEDEPLAGDVTALAFKYYDGTQWLETWHSEDEGDLLPLAIEVSIDITTKDPRTGGGDKVYHMTRVVPIACADATALAERGAS